MIYTTGSIAVSGNTLTGTGTNFTAAGSLIRNGCTVLALTSPAQAFQITSVDSATGLTVTPAASPSVPAGAKFAILLSDSLSVDGLAQDIAETFSMYQRYMGGFADVMNGSGDVTITINGQPVTVPGQKSLAKKGANTDITSLGGLTTALSIQQGGTGSKSADDARKNLGIVDSTGTVPVSLGGTGAKSSTDSRVNLGAASAGDNNDVTSFSGVIAPRGSINSRLSGGASVKLDLGGALGTAVKPFNLNLTRLGNATNNWNIQSTYGYLVGDDGSFNASGPIMISTDGSSTDRVWIFRNSDGAIKTTYGTISPGASDERVKNIVREITEEEAIKFISEVRPIRYAFKWRPEQIKVGFRAQNIEALDPELVEITSLTIPGLDGSDIVIQDGKMIDPGEIGAAYLVPVVQQLLRRVSELEAEIKTLNPQGS